MVVDSKLNLYIIYTYTIYNYTYVKWSPFLDCTNCLGHDHALEINIYSTHVLYQVSFGPVLGTVNVVQCTMYTDRNAIQMSAI